MNNKLIFYSSSPQMKIADIENTILFPQSEQIQQIQIRCQKNKVWGAYYKEESFHYKFKYIVPKVKLYYYQGNKKLLNHPILAVVGPRNISNYAKEVSKQLIDKAQNYQLSTISWLAPGVDQYIHKLSMEKNIPTIAVLGGGIKRYYEHKKEELLQTIIQKNGLILSEFKLDFSPTYYSFPQRNRLIAWLANLVYIPQAGIKSGSLITADFAIAMQKPVYWAPNHIFSSQHEGLHRYLQEQKIKLNIFPEDLLKKFFSHKNQPQKKQNIQLSPPLQEILFIFQKHEQLNYEQLIHYSKKNIAKLNALINILEIKGIIYTIAPGIFRIKK